MCQGDKFIKIAKWDRQYVKFVTDQSLDLRAGRVGGSVDTAFYDTLVALRQKAADWPVSVALHVPAEAEESLGAIKMRKAILAKHNKVLPPILSHHVGGATVQPDAGPDPVRRLGQHEALGST